MPTTRQLLIELCLIEVETIWEFGLLERPHVSLKWKLTSQNISLCDSKFDLFKRFWTFAEDVHVSGTSSAKTIL